MSLRNHSFRWFSRLASLALLAIVTVGCDRVTKDLAEARLSGLPGQSLLADTIRLEYAENPGAFLSLGATWPPALRTGVFTVGSGLILLALVGAAIRQRWSGPPLAGVALLVAGGGSNLVDRAVRGSVVDFMNIGVGPLRTGIFNVADVAVMAGVVLVLAKLVAGRRPA